MTVFLRSFTAFSVILQLSVSSLVLAMEEKKWSVGDEKEQGKGVVRIASLRVPSSFEIRNLLDDAAITCITLQNIQYALVNFRFDLNINENPQLQRPQEFYKRMECNLCGKKMDDASYGPYLRERIQGNEKDLHNYQGHYAKDMAKLYPYETTLISSQMDRTTPTVFRYLAGPPAITVKNNTAQVYGDYLEKRISMGDTAALLLKLEGLNNGTLGFEEDQSAVTALRRDLIAKGLLQEEKKEEKKVEGHNVSLSSSSSVKARSSAAALNRRSALSEVEALSATHHTLFDIKNLIEKHGGRAAITFRKKKKIFKIDVTLQGQSQTFYQQGDKRMRSKQLKEFIQTV